MNMSKLKYVHRLWINLLRGQLNALKEYRNSEDFHYLNSYRDCGNKQIYDWLLQFSFLGEQQVPKAWE